MNASKNGAAEKPRKPRPSPSKARRAAEFPAVTPPPALFAPKPLDQQADVRIGAVVRTSDGREGIVKAAGKYRVRLIFADGRPPAVLLRGQLASLVAPAPGPKRAGAKGPKTLRLSPSGSVGELSRALASWGVPRERLVEALRAALAMLEAE